MKILPKRTMFLDNQRVVAGKAVDVSDSEGKLAIRHGWATEVEAGKKGAVDKGESALQGHQESKD